MNDTFNVIPSVLSGRGKARPDLHFDEVQKWPISKIKVKFHLSGRPMTKSRALECIKSKCQPALGNNQTKQEPLGGALENMSIHKLRKLAGYKKLEKGMSRQDYISIIRGEK